MKATVNSACGNVPFQIPSAAMCRFKFRRWKCLRLARLALSAGIKTCMVLIVQIYMSILP